MSAETLRKIAAHHEAAAGAQELQATMADRNAAIPNLHPVAAEARREVAQRHRDAAAQLRSCAEACTAGAAAIDALEKVPA